MGANADLRSPSAQQRDAISLWQAGHNVSCTACAGAGKSTLLAHVCAVSSAPVLVLAYNRQLANDTRKLLEANAPLAQCYTFHGLCTHLDSLTVDDDDLDACIVRFEAFKAQGRPVMQQVRHVCVDEAQDLKPLYVRLINCLFATAQIFLVGDPVQMLYDYDVHDSASTAYMSDPSEHFPVASAGEWKRCRLGDSFRISPAICAVVNNALEPAWPSLVARGNSTDVVEVHSLSPYRWADVVMPCIRRHGATAVLLLCETRNGNRPLTHLLNCISAAPERISIHVHGDDAADERGPEGKLRVMTWHASKGTEAPVAVVLGVSSRSKHNPLHVALTRASRRLVVVQDAHSRHPSLDVAGVERLLESRSIISNQASLIPPAQQHAHFAGRSASRRPIDVSYARYRGRLGWTESCVHAVRQGVASSPSAEDACQETMIRLSTGWEDVGTLMCKVVLHVVEWCTSRRCVEVERITSARFIDSSEDEAMLLLSGAQERWHRAPAHTMLPTQLRGLVNDAVEVLRRSEATEVSGWTWQELQAAIVVACGCLSWGGYHHKMRQLLPPVWCNASAIRTQCVQFFRFLRELASDEDCLLRAEYDLRAHRVLTLPCGSNVILHGRVPLLVNRNVVILRTEDEASKEDVAHAALLLCLLQTRADAAQIYHVKSAVITSVRVTDEQFFLQKFFSGQ